MATIQERKAASGQSHYRVMVRIKGRPPVTATFQRKTDAKRWAQRTEADIRRGRFFRHDEASRHTLADLVAAYVEDRLPTLSRADQANRRRQLAWWVERLGAYFLADLRPGLIAEARRDLAQRGKTGKPVGAATQNRYLAALSAALTYAVRELEWLGDNPARKVPKPAEPRGRVRFLGTVERERLLNACRESPDPRLLPLVLTAISTGMRQGELLRLRWNDIDIHSGFAVVHESKNDQRRAVPVPPPALAALQELRKAAKRPDAQIFVAPSGKALFPKKPWLRALLAAEIENFTFHDCRHTAASYLAMSGATLAEIAEILGHKTLQMVRRYAHLSERHTARVSNRMADRFLSS